ncbi:apiosidase-like domain-containing protein [Thalassotalea agariperforans]
MLHRLFLITLLLLSTQSLAAISQHNFSAQPISIEQWQVADIILKSHKPIAKPFEQEIFAHFENQQRIPLFYNGDNQWVLRYSNAKTGSFSYQIKSEIPELNTLTGTIKVNKNTKQNRHGAITLNKANPQHFYYESGKPYFSLAFEADWLFALDYNLAELKKTNHLLDLVKNNGFNQVVTTLYSYDVYWEKDPKLKQHPEFEYGAREDIFPFLGSNTTPDFSSLNLEFFQHYDHVMSAMHDREIVNHLMIYVWNKMVNWPELGSPEDNRYFDYIIKRYQAFPNIIWDISKEALFYKNTTKNYIADRVDRARELDSFNRLVTVHDYGFCAQHPHKVDFISTQDWKHTIYSKMLEVRSKFPTHPIVNIEHGGYEYSPIRVFPGAYENAEVALRRNYMSLFAGVYNTYYWQGTSWNVVIHNPFEQDESFTKPKFHYFSIMKQLMDKYPFSEFTPNPNQNSSGYNLTDHKTGTVLLYIPKENYSIALGFLTKNGDKYRYQWLNTLTGEIKEKGIIKDQFSFYQSPWREQADTILIATKI